MVQPRLWAWRQLRWESSERDGVVSGDVKWGLLGNEWELFLKKRWVLGVLLTDKIAGFRRCCSSLGFGLLVHFRMRLAYEGELAVIAEGDPFEHIFHPQQLDYPETVCDMGVCE